MNKKILKTFFLFFLMLFAGRAFAGGISIERALPQGSDIKVGDEVLINIEIENPETSYNAVSGSLTFNSHLKIERIITGNSIVSVWLENPFNFKDGVIDFSGIIPSGYNGRTGNIFSIVVKVTGSGGASIALREAELFVNDGLGTPEKVANKNLTMNAKTAPPGYEPYLIAVRDVNPPEDFKVEVIKDPNLFDGAYVLAFSTQDKGSGVRAYDVLEGRRVFKQVDVPYLLENQRLNETIYVRAIDNEGNVREVRVHIPGKTCIGRKCFGWPTLIILAFVAGITLVLLWRKKIKKLI